MIEYCIKPSLRWFVSLQCFFSYETKVQYIVFRLFLLTYTRITIFVYLPELKCANSGRAEQGCKEKVVTRTNHNHIVLLLVDASQYSVAAPSRAYEKIYSLEVRVHL